MLLRKQSAIVWPPFVHLCAAGRGRKAAAEDAEWDWQRSRLQVLLAVHDVMRADLRTLFRGLSAAERMVNLCMELVGG